MATLHSDPELSAEVSKLVEPVQPIRAAGQLADKAALDAACTALHVVPSREEVGHRQRTLQQLQQILLGDHAQSSASRLPPQLVVVPVGAYGLDVWTPASGLDCLCIGVYTSATFFALATQRLRRAASTASSWTVRRVRTAAGESALQVDDGRGLPIRLQYCQAAVVAETWPAFLTKPPALSPQTLARLKAVRDLVYLRQSFPVDTGHRLCTAALFSAAHRAIQAWACARGLYAARFGYLDDMQIAVLLARVMKLMQAALADPVDGNSLPDILATFFRHYAHFDWTARMAFDPFFHHDKTPHVPTAREPLVILGYHRPQLNASQAATASSARILAAEFQRADRVLSNGTTTTWETFLRGGGSSDDPTTAVASSLPPGPADFVHAYRTFLKIDLQYWSLSPQRSAALMGWLESHSLFLLSADLARRLPQLHVRLWPGRFTEHEDASADADDNKVSEYRGFYLVGVDLPADMAAEERQQCQNTLQLVLAALERQVRSGGGNAYDAQRMWLGTGVVNRADLGNVDRLCMDARAWEGEQGDEEEAEDEEEVEWETSEKEGETRRNKDKKKDKDDKETAAVGPPGGNSKFRSAQDVIKRLRWDPNLDPADYIVGYEDRFVGACERALDAWKSEQTDDEFIPQHRILYFRRRTDGMVVWDRRARQDDVFGSR